MKRLSLLVLAFLFLSPFLSSADQYIPVHVETQIKQDATFRYPHDYRMQEATIRIERESYLALLNLRHPTVLYAVVEQVKQWAARQFPGQYATQLVTVNRDLAAYIQIENFSGSSISDIGWGEFFQIKERAEIKHPEGYLMQLTEIHEQIAALRRMRR